MRQKKDILPTSLDLTFVNPNTSRFEEKENKALASIKKNRIVNLIIASKTIIDSLTS